MEKDNASKYIGSGEYLVGYLDIIGFKYILYKYGLETVHNSLKVILSNLRSALQTGRGNDSFYFQEHFNRKKSNKVWVSDAERDILINGFFNFSDTIILYVKLSNNDEENVILFKSMCSLMNDFISTSIQEPKTNEIRLPFRGAISKGDGLVDEELQIHIGDPFIRAYALAESQNWMGGAIDNNIEEDWVHEIIGFDKKIIEYCIPLDKCKLYKYKLLNSMESIKYALNWTESYPYRFGPKLVSQINSYDWGDEKEEKRENTLKFIEMVLQNRDKSSN